DLGSLPADDRWPARGRGDVSLWLEADDGSVTSGTVALSLADVVWPGTSDAAAGYERLALRGEWLRAPDGWRAVLSDVEVTRGGRRWPQAAELALEVGGSDERWDRLSFRGDFLRLEDLEPVVALVPPEIAEPWSALDPGGDLRNARLE